MKNILIVFIGIIGLISMSCEDVIDVELNKIEPRLVVEGVLNDIEGNCTIRLSKTGDYFNPSDYPAVENAKISLKENSNEEIFFTEKSNGIYEIPSIKGKVSAKYSLKIETEGETYSANLTMPEKVNIDSLSFIYTPATPRDPEGFLINCHFQEPLNTDNYYRMKAYIKGDSTEANQTFYIFDDKLISGNNTTMAWRYNTFQMFDTVIVELQTLDKSTYDFYKTLSEISGGGNPMASSTPANPESNIDNNALGYFGIYTLSKMEITISR